MLVLNYLVDELLRDVGHWVQVQRHHPCQLVCENFDEVDPSVRADNDLVPETRGLHLVNVTDLLEPFSYVH